MDTVKSLDPTGGFIQINAKGFGLGLADLDVSGCTVGMVRFVVDDHQVFMARQLAQHASGKGFVAFFALFDHRTIGGFQRHQGVPVFNQHLSAVEFLAHRLRGTQIKDIVIVVSVARHQHLQT